MTGREGGRCTSLNTSKEEKGSSSDQLGTMVSSWTPMTDKGNENEIFDQRTAGIT